MAEIQSDRGAQARARLLTLSTASHSHVSKQHSALLTPVSSSSSSLLCYVLYCSVEAAAIATQRSAFSTILAGSILGSQCVSFYEF